MGRNPEGLGNFFGYNHLLNAGVAALLAGSMAMGSEPPAQARQISPDTSPRPSPPITDPDPGFQAQVDLVNIPPYRIVETSKNGRLIIRNSSPTQGIKLNQESDFSKLLVNLNVPSLSVVHDPRRRYPEKPSGEESGPFRFATEINPDGRITVYYDNTNTDGKPFSREQANMALHGVVIRTILVRQFGETAVAADEAHEKTDYQPADKQTKETDLPIVKARKQLTDTMTHAQPFRFMSLK